MKQENPILPPALALGALILMAVLSSPASAGKVLIEDSRCAQLAAADLATLEKDLRAKKVIAVDDTIECKAPPSTAASQRNFPLTTLLPAIGSLFCRQKNADMLEACGKFENRAARDKCRAEERARFTGVAKVC